MKVKRLVDRRRRGGPLLAVLGLLHPPGASALAEALASRPLPPDASFFALALLCGDAFFAAACFFAEPRGFSGAGGCNASSSASSIALETTGSTLALPGAAARPGVIGQEVSTAGAAFLDAFLDLAARLAAFFAARANSAALAGAEAWSPCLAFASAVAARLFGPRIGRRGVKIHPTPGTGLPPISRPSSKSHGCSPWNSWNESLERTVAPVRSAMRSTNASPRPMAPAGGEIISPLSIALRTSSRSASEHAVLERGVHDHDDVGARVLGLIGADGLVELLETRGASAFGGQVRPVHHDMVCCQPMARRNRSACSNWCRAALPMAGLADSVRLT